MIKSYQKPVTLPTVVSSYFEPSVKNIPDYVGGNRTAHQMYVAHQIRLLNTILGAVKGKFGANPKEIAAQNRDLAFEDHLHLKNIIDYLHKVELIDHQHAEQMHEQLCDVFAHFFPQFNSTSNLIK